MKPGFCHVHLSTAITLLLGAGVFLRLNTICWDPEPSDLTIEDDIGCGTANYVQALEHEKPFVFGWPYPIRTAKYEGDFFSLFCVPIETQRIEIQKTGKWVWSWNGIIKNLSLCGGLLGMTAIFLEYLIRRRAGKLLAKIGAPLQ